MPRVRSLAAEVAANDQDLVRRLTASYRAGAAGTLADALDREQEEFRAWRPDPAGVEVRRAAITERGSRQAGS